MVFTGGGDGTLLNCLTELKRHHDRSNHARRFPLFGVLHLGTGNAVASFLGANPRVIPNIKQAIQGQGFNIRSQHWVEVNNQIAPFAGTGLDSLMINHYKQLKDRLFNTPFSFLTSGLKGYIFALLAKTVPHLIQTKRPDIEVINDGDVAYLIGDDGRYVKEIASGEVIYKGPAMMCSVSTVPFYGYNVKAFPFAYSGDKMQLRIVYPSVAKALFNAGGLCKGTFRDEKILDFHVQKIKVRSSEPLPLQIGGDAADYHSELTYTLSETSTQLVDFTKTKQLPAFRPASPQLGI